jgi:hypothetical protein
LVLRNGVSAALYDVRVAALALRGGETVRRVTARAQLVLTAALRGASSLRAMASDAPARRIAGFVVGGVAVGARVLGARLLRGLLLVTARTGGGRPLAVGVVAADTIGAVRGFVRPSRGVSRLGCVAVGARVARGRRRCVRGVTRRAGGVRAGFRSLVTRMTAVARRGRNERRTVGRVTVEAFSAVRCPTLDELGVAAGARRAGGIARERVRRVTRRAVAMLPIARRSDLGGDRAVALGTPAIRRLGRAMCSMA